MTSERDINVGGRVAGALNEAEKIIEGARQRAEDIITEAQTLKASAKEDGYRAGVEEAKLELARAAIKIIEDKSKLNEVLAKEAAKLAIAICGTIIEHEVTQSPDIIKNIAMKALKDAVVGERVTIIVNSADVSVLETGKSDLVKIANNAAIQIQGDDRLVRGSCKILTEFGEVDASVSALLEAVKTRLGVE